MGTGYTTVGDGLGLGVVGVALGEASGDGEGSGDGEQATSNMTKPIAVALRILTGPAYRRVSTGLPAGAQGYVVLLGEIRGHR
ncbi:MAG: hypothetical protein Q4D79_07815 [Propionibacteriaceae bacterium]|nr:hypothetical protein [Propionibacteriaceae bacterium]